ncbi:MAG: hypothetical protein HWD61_02305 [Parachlamydiaceae bacterium]|nr:MAG: hypothetical protein HWD61_02305 [Parachlamydiaceae bacterium]
MLEAKRLVLLHEKLDQPPRVRAETIESEAKNYLNHLLRAEQSKALSLQNQIKEEKVIENLITWTARGVFTIGVALFLTTFPLLIFAGGIIGLPFMFLGALLSMGAGPYIGYLPDRQSLIIERKLEQILNEMEKLHTCKNIVTEPEFVAFAEDPKNRFQFLRTMKEILKSSLRFIAFKKIMN